MVLVVGAKWAVYIGRFQPFHNGHLNTVLQALDQVDKLIVFIGSSNRQDGNRNPWSARDRFFMIRDSIPSSLSNRVIILNLPDLDNDERWYKQVQIKVAAELGFNQDNNIKLFGLDKDASTYYLNGFPNWERIQVETGVQTDATTVRNLIATGDPSWKDLVPKGVLDYLST